MVSPFKHVFTYPQTLELNTSFKRSEFKGYTMNKLYNVDIFFWWRL